MPDVLIRNVPSDVQVTLKERAERRGQSLQQYLREELVQLAAKPTIAELMDRIESRFAADRPAGVAPQGSFDSVAALHEARAERDERNDRPAR